MSLLPFGWSLFFFCRFPSLASGPPFSRWSLMTEESSTTRRRCKSAPHRGGRESIEKEGRIQPHRPKEEEGGENCTTSRIKQVRLPRRPHNKRERLVSSRRPLSKAVQKKKCASLHTDRGHNLNTVASKRLPSTSKGWCKKGSGTVEEDGSPTGAQGPTLSSLAQLPGRRSTRTSIQTQVSPREEGPCEGTTCWRQQPREVESSRDRCCPIPSLELPQNTD